MKLEMFQLMLAAELAAVQPERFSHLVLIDAFGLWLRDCPTLDFFAASPSDLSHALYFDQESSAAKYLWPLPNRGLDRRLHRISMPTLVVWGEQDGVMSPRYGEALQAGIPGARLEIVPRAGHLPHAEQAAAVAAITQAFLAEIRA